jgi:flagellar motor switch protein FliN
MPKKEEEKKEEVQETAEIAEVTEEAAKEAESADETSAVEDSNNEAEVTVEKLSDIELGEVDPDAPVTVQPVKFGSFEDLSQAQGESNKNLDILMDIKLQLTVELGRTELPIRKVLELTRGSIIELEKVAGEPVELYANGKLVAHGEVVVIEDNFGLRITSITEPEERLKGIGS